MSEVMQTRSVAVVLATQADLARQRVEGTVNLSTVKLVFDSRKSKPVVSQ